MAFNFPLSCNSTKIWIIEASQWERSPAQRDRRRVSLRGVLCRRAASSEELARPRRRAEADRFTFGHDGHLTTREPVEPHLRDGACALLSLRCVQYFSFARGRALREHNSGAQWGGVMWLRMNIIAFITSLWMTPSSALLSFPRVGNGQSWNWILYTQRWLYKGNPTGWLLHHHGCNETDSEVTTVQRKVTVNIWWSPAVQYRSLPAVEETPPVELSSLGRLTRTLCLLRSPSFDFFFFPFYSALRRLCWRNTENVWEPISWDQRTMLAIVHIFMCIVCVRARACVRTDLCEPVTRAHIQAYMISK